MKLLVILFISYYMPEYTFLNKKIGKCVSQVTVLCNSNEGGSESFDINISIKNKKYIH